jgi:hypothetical protein
MVMVMPTMVAVMVPAPPTAAVVPVMVMTMVAMVNAGNAIGRGGRGRCSSHRRKGVWGSRG